MEPSETVFVVCLAFCFISIAFSAKKIEEGNIPADEEIPHDKSYRILILTNYASKSHMNIFIPIAKSLINRRHEVTLITPYSLKDKIRGLKEEVILPKATEVFTSWGNMVFSQGSKDPISLLSFMEQSINDTCYFMFTNPRIKELLEEAASKKQTLFDVVLLNAYFNECTYPIGYLLADHMVSLSPAELLCWTAAFMGISSNPAAIPIPFLGLSNKLTFEDRITGTVLQTFFVFVRNFFYKRYYQRSIDEFLPGVPSISEIEDSIALSLINHDPVLHMSRPLAPNVIAVPALHCRPSRPLPKELLDFIEISGEDGFILFSLGSIVSGSNLPEATRDAFIKTFSQLKLKVIWKFEAEIENLPSNVKLVKWIPQQDLLGHSKIRLFITHGGLFSLQESLYHGVPAIGVPIFADQPSNVRRLEELEIGLSANLNNITSDGLLDKITTILSNSSYAVNAKKYSTILKDYPISSVESATFWIEYLIRHQGAAHLKVHGKNLNFFQYFLLDVIALLLLCAISTFLLLRFVFRILLRLLRNIVGRLRKAKTD